MANSPRDANQVTAAAGDFNGVVVPISIDHATGYAKAVITNQVLATPSVNAALAGRDNNGVRTSLGSFNGATRTLKVTNADGLLRAVIN